jgi:phospholipid/cholesterol/gamma-HCH transport system substrate-binding protein
MARHNAIEVAAGAVVLLIAAGFLTFVASNTGRTSLSGMPVSALFDNVGAISSGADVRISGVKVGSVTGVAIDPQSYRARIGMTVQRDIKLPADSSATISSSGLLGGAFITLQPGGDEKMLQDGGQITITQSATNLEDLLGKFIFNVGSLADASQKQLQRDQAQDGGQAGHRTP